MRKLVLLLILLWGYTNACFASTLLTGNGIITYPQEKEKGSEVLFDKHPFTVSEVSDVTLHFISNIDNYVVIRVINSETENEIRAFCKRISRGSSPFNETVNMAAGNYTLMVYKVKSTNSSHNTGAYRFVITADALAQQKVVVPEVREAEPVVAKQSVVQEASAAANNGNIATMPEKIVAKQESSLKVGEKQDWLKHITDLLDIVISLKTGGALSVLYGIFSLIRKIRGD